MMKIEYRPSTGSRVVRDLSDPRLAAATIMEGSPVRGFASHATQPHKPGLYWMASVGCHVPYESKLERTYLAYADLVGDVTAILAQPFIVHFGLKQGPRRHTPDYLLLGRDGTAEVVNVKGTWALAKPLTAERFELTARMCGELGWRFTVFTELDPVTAANVEFLAGYRSPTLRAADEHAPRLVDAVGDGTTFTDAVRALTVAGVPPYLAPAVIWRAAWNRLITFPLDLPLGGGTRLRVADAGGGS